MRNYSQKRNLILNFYLFIQDYSVKNYIRLVGVKEYVCETQEWAIIFFYTRGFALRCPDSAYLLQNAEVPYYLGEWVQPLDISGPWQPLRLTSQGDVFFLKRQKLKPSELLYPQ